MRLNAGGVRELHWHKAAEWAYMLYGAARITAVDGEGRNFVDDVSVGDLWYFPSGIPHSIQGLGPDGCEFLLVFDDGSFDEDELATASLSRSVQEQLLLRCISRHVDGADTARTGPGAFAPGRANDGRAAKREKAHRAGVAGSTLANPATETQREPMPAPGTGSFEETDRRHEREMFA
jgi:hypothetical protein